MISDNPNENRDFVKESETKKITPIEKAGISGVASGATIEGLSALMGAEEIPYEEVPLALKIPRHVICEWCEDRIQKSPMLVPSMSDKLALVCSQECADDISGLIDQDANLPIRQDFRRTINVKKYQSEETPSAYWFLKTEIANRAPLNEMDLSQILEMLQNVPAKEMNEAMEEAEMMGDEAAMIVLVMADNKRKFREEYASEYEEIGTMSVAPARGYTGYMNMMSSARRMVEIGNETGLDQKLGEAYQDESGRWFLPILERKASEEEEEESRKDKLKGYFEYMKERKPEVAQAVEFAVKNEDEIPEKLIWDNGYNPDIIEEWVDLVGIEDENLQPYESCPTCEGEGIIVTNYYPATRYDPPDIDYILCEECIDGEYDPAFYMDKEGQYYAESFEAEDYYWTDNEDDGEVWSEHESGWAVVVGKKDIYIEDPYNAIIEGGFSSMEDAKNAVEKILNTFEAENHADRQLEESIKRTKMSAIRTGLAITTFGIVMLNLWINRKQSQEIDKLNKKD